MRWSLWQPLPGRNLRFHPNEEIRKILADRMDVHPSIGALAFAAAAEILSRITRTASVITLAGIRLMAARLAVTSAKAQRELGVTFRPFAATLADTVAWTKASLADRSNPPSPAISGSARQTA